MTSRPIYEQIGDVISGAPFVHAHWQTRWVDQMQVVATDLPLLYGKAYQAHWTEFQTAPDGWKRQVPHALDIANDDPTRASAKYVVVLVTAVPAGKGRDAGYGGGWLIHIKRLADDGSYDPDGEEIKYGRRNTSNYDYADPIERLYTVTGPLLDQIHKAALLATLTPAQKVALGMV